MSWLPWVQMLGAALGTVNPAAAALLSMIVGGVTTLDADNTEDQALAEQWYQFCVAMIAHGGPPTEGEHQEALDFANSVHARNQSL